MIWNSKLDYKTGCIWNTKGRTLTTFCFRLYIFLKNNYSMVCIGKHKYIHILVLTDFFHGILPGPTVCRFSFTAWSPAKYELHFPCTSSRRVSLSCWVRVAQLLFIFMTCCQGLLRATSHILVYFFYLLPRYVWHEWSRPLLALLACYPSWVGVVQLLFAFLTCCPGLPGRKFRYAVNTLQMGLGPKLISCKRTTAYM